MAFKYTGDAALGIALTVEIPKPLDNRTVVNNLSELYSIPEKYAYQGMTVANIDNGNIYMLIDKSKIKEKEGWKASYESIQIISCTEQEYKERSNNTTDDFKPIDESKPYLHAETYYYIYEDSIDDNQFYLSAEWGKDVLNQLSQKALNSTVVQLRNDLETTNNEFSKYSTLEYLTENYVPKSDLSLDNAESFLSQTLSKYYTKSETDNIFVTKESLRGEGMEGDDFVFVTQNQYNSDQQNINNILDTTVKTGDDASLNSLSANKIKSSDGQLEINISSEGLFTGNEQFAVVSQIPKLTCLPQTEYDTLLENNQTKEDTYYFTYGKQSMQDTGYIRSEYLTEKYYTKTEVDELIKGLQNQIDELKALITG